MSSINSCFADNVVARPSQSFVIGQLDELTINWHVTEACNFSCKYCYAQWKDHPDPRELFHDLDRTHTLLKELHRFFHPHNSRNPLKQFFSWRTVRLNIAGGEPSILNGRLLDIVRIAHEIGYRVSIISNGSKLTRNTVLALAPNLTCLGISLDSGNTATNLEIGRADRLGNVVNPNEMATNICAARSANPKLSIKVNTVVNSANVNQDFTNLIQLMNPDRWKILRMLPVTNQSLAISSDQFEMFVHRHRHLASMQCIEDHQDMTESYLMVDPFGRFFQNKSELDGCGYYYSPPILEIGAQSAFSEMTFNATSFMHRYAFTNLRSMP